MLSNLLRMLIGFAGACLVAGATSVLFVTVPANLVSADEAAMMKTGMLVLYTATQFAVFSAQFALIPALIGEWQRVRSVGYYMLIGILIALVGYVTLISGEREGQNTVLNSYAFRSFLTAGFFGGLAYWMLAGRRAGGKSAD